MLSIIRAALQQIIDDIDNGNCTMSEEQINGVMGVLSSMNNKNDWMSKEESARYLNMSLSTFERRVADGTIPNGKKRSGLREKLWNRSELDSIRNK